MNKRKSLQDFLKYATDETIARSIENATYNSNLFKMNVLASYIDLEVKNEKESTKEETAAAKKKRKERVKELNKLKKELLVDASQTFARGDVSNVLETELLYFRPLVNELIQRHIDENGKDMPMYFSGFELASLLQTNPNTGLIYAGPEEVAQLVAFEQFKFGDISYTAYLENTGQPVYREEGEKITKKEYTRVYNQAKTEAVDNIIRQIADKLLANRSLHPSYYPNNIFTPMVQIPISDIKASLKEWKNDTSISNRDRTNRINQYNTELFNLTNNKPLVVGPLYTAMNAMPGVKLSYVSEVPGIKQVEYMGKDAGGYLVDLSNYNYKAAMLYGLDTRIDSMLEKGASDPIVTPINMDQKAQQNVKGKEIVYKLAQKLSDQLGIPFVMLTKQQALDLLKTSHTPYQGENAFFFDGKVYLVGDNVSTKDVLHEFAHPLVRSIAVENPTLFNKIFQDLLGTSEGKEIIKNVIDSYGKNYEYLQEEAIVRALTARTKQEKEKC